MGKLMPVLKPIGYRKDVPFFYKKALFNSSSSPVIALGTDEGHRIDYETAANQQEYDAKLPELYKKALENLKQVEPNLDIQDAGGAKVAFITGHEYASEKILDSSYMKMLSQKLGAPSLMVGIPFKGHLIAVDVNSDIRMKFAAIIKKYYDNPQQDPISEYVFLVNDGEVTGMGGNNIPEEPYVISENATTNNYTVKVSVKTIDELTETVNGSFQQIMAMVLTRKVFGGQINYYLTNSMPINNQLIDKCNSYVAQIQQNEMAQTISKTLTGAGINLSFYYEGKLIPSKADANTADSQAGTGTKKSWWQFWK